jgi:hypothetical protein
LEDLRVSICTDDQILAESASFILARTDYALRLGAPTSTYICAGRFSEAVPSISRSL